MNPLRAIDSMTYRMPYVGNIVPCRKHRTGGMDETFGGLGILRRQLLGPASWYGRETWVLETRGKRPVSPGAYLPVNHLPDLQLGPALEKFLFWQRIASYFVNGVFSQQRDRF